VESNQRLLDDIQHVADSNRRRLRSSSFSKLVIRRTRLSTLAIVRFRWLEAASGTVRHQTSPQLQRCFFSEPPQNFVSFPDHFLPNCFWFLVLCTMYNSGLACLVLSQRLKLYITVLYSLSMHCWFIKSMEQDILHLV